MVKLLNNNTLEIDSNDLVDFKENNEGRNLKKFIMDRFYTEVQNQMLAEYRNLPISEIEQFTSKYFEEKIAPIANYKVKLNEEVNLKDFPVNKEILEGIDLNGQSLDSVSEEVKPKANKQVNYTDIALNMQLC